MPRNAREAGISRLFHYEKFDAHYFADCLVNQRIYCSDPANLNDPWDCRPWFSEQVLEDPDTLEGFLEWLTSFKPTVLVCEEELAAIKDTLRKDADERKALLERFSKRFMDTIPGRWRLYCLTPFPDSTLMWSHYADNHRGICLEFSTDYFLFGSALEVQYLSAYPQWSPQALMDKTNPHMLLSKSRDWSYESEYRIIGLGEGLPRPPAGHALELKGQFLNIPKGALQAVIVGCEADFPSVTNVATRSAPGLKIKRVVQSRTQYKLEIVAVV